MSGKTERYNLYVVLDKMLQCNLLVSLSGGSKRSNGRTKALAYTEDDYIIEILAHSKAPAQG